MVGINKKEEGKETKQLHILRCSYVCACVHTAFGYNCLTERLVDLFVCSLWGWGCTLIYPAWSSEAQWQTTSESFAFASASFYSILSLASTMVCQDKPLLHGLLILPGIQPTPAVVHDGALGH